MAERQHKKKKSYYRSTIIIFAAAIVIGFTLGRITTNTIPFVDVVVPNIPLTTTETATTTIINNERVTTSTAASILSAFERDIEYCDNNNNNIVMKNSGDALRYKKMNTTQPTQPFSIIPETFYRHHHRDCETLDETLAAIRDGKRQRLRGEQHHQQEEENNEIPSYFIPAGCNVPPLRAHDICKIFSQYSDIALDGDSIGRHIRQGVMMAMREDLILGAIESNKIDPYNDCRCDGQFSEALDCRQNDGLFHNFTPRQLGICSFLSQDEQFRFPALYQGFSEGIDFPCEDPDYKGLLLILQAGPWFIRDYGGQREDDEGPAEEGEMSEVKLLALKREKISTWFEDHFNSPVFQKCLELDKVQVLWLGFGTSQTPSKDEIYGKNSRNNIERYNKKTRRYLEWRASINNIPVTIVDWLNMTWQQLASDGFHGLAEVNLMKAYHIANVVSMMAKERRDERQRIMATTNVPISKIEFPAD